ncbi:MAG: hypothetical protein UU21_C0005G0015 [Candidatus Levybacteria bacterium GW2011_GWA2_40_8]|nr:MAG: hypothetical protein UU21_C0005G0015 [Candidatus Levybacteria bacterium GW2011_GWA2_40_8]
MSESQRDLDRSMAVAASQGAGNTADARADLGFYDPAYGDFARDLGSVPGKLEDHGFKRVSPPMNGNSSGGGFS